MTFGSRNALFYPKYATLRQEKAFPLRKHSSSVHGKSRRILLPGQKGIHMPINNVKKRETGRTPKYGMFSCVRYTYQLLWNTERELVFAGILTVPVSLMLSAVTLYTPAAVLSVLETSERFSTISMVIIGLLLVKLLFDLAQNLISAKVEYAQHRVRNQMMYLWNSKRRDRDWNHEFDPEIQRIDERSRNAFQSTNAAGAHFPMDFADIVSSLLNFLLFGSVISLLNPVIILLLIVGCMLNYFADRWKRQINLNEKDQRNDLLKKLNYSTRDISIHFEYAKDMRLYNMEKPLLDRLAYIFDLNLNEMKRVERRNVLTALVSFLVILIRDAAAYTFLIYKAVNGEVDASSFILYFSAITSMSTLMDKVLQILNRIFDGAIQVSDFRESMDLKDHLNRGRGIPVPRGPFSIEFKNVSYQYPQGEKKVLDNISFKIAAGEKIALVGLNGAGKTTLTMLMCGLLLPDEGEILLDGHSLYEYNRDEMYALFGSIPQKYNLLPVSIAQNIASAMTVDEIDDDRLQYCIEVAGLSEKIKTLPNGASTLLNRTVNKDAVELSGGETQKLLLARLLYKDPPCIILDEPTAALDPIAEDKMYRSYNAIARNATSIFISHRLASTRFCDRIFLLDGAKFAESGSHEELMAAGKKYRELFDIQSSYYRKAWLSEENDRSTETD